MFCSAVLSPRNNDGGSSGSMTDVSVVIDGPDVSGVEGESQKSQNELQKKTENDGKWNPNNEWQVVGRSRNKRPEPTKGVKVCVPQLAVAKPKLAWIFLSGFHPDTAPEKISEYLKGNGINECECYKMKTRKDKIKSSFKLSVPMNRRREAMSPDLWPTGIIINHFLNLQRRQTEQMGVTG